MANVKRLMNMLSVGVARGRPREVGSYCGRSGGCGSNGVGLTSARSSPQVDDLIRIPRFLRGTEELAVTGIRPGQTGNRLLSGIPWCPKSLPAARACTGGCRNVKRGRDRSGGHAPLCALVAYAVAPPQLEPAPAVHPKQCGPTTMRRPARAPIVASKTVCGAPDSVPRSIIWLKSQS